MDWKKFFIVFLRSSVILLIVSSLGIGLFGWITGGLEGLKGGLIWGLVFGSVAIPFIAYTAVAKAYEGFAHHVGGSIMKNQIEGERTPPEPEEKYFK